MSFTLLRTFHAVAEKRGFTAAAQMLGIGQPTVTTQIQELERAYAVELFARVGRRVELTEAGEALFAVTKRMIGLREEAHEVLVTHGRLDTGHLRLAAVGPFHVTEIIARFRAVYPAVGLSVALGNSEQTLARVRDLEADIGLMAHTIADPRIHSVSYRTHRLVIFVGRDHAWFRRRKPATLEELAQQPLVLREKGSTTRLALEAALEQAGLAVRPVFEIGSREGVWKAVERGLGISVVADFELVAHPNLHAIEIAGEAIRTEYRLVCLQERQTSPKIRAFAAIAQQLREEAEEAPLRAGQARPPTTPPPPPPSRSATRSRAKTSSAP